MTKQEFKECVEHTKYVSLSDPVDIDVLLGCGRPDFKPVFVTKEQVSYFIKWQCLMFNGTWNMEMMNECWHIARYRFTLIGG